MKLEATRHVSPKKRSSGMQSWVSPLFCYLVVHLFFAVSWFVGRCQGEAAKVFFEEVQEGQAREEEQAQQAQEEVMDTLPTMAVT